MFAKSRIPKLTARAIYETNSINIIKGAITVGVTVGYKRVTNRILCKEKPNNVIVTIVAILSIKVKEASLVDVSTPGTIPIVFAVKIAACNDDVMTSLSSHSEESESSSSKINTPALPKAKAIQSLKLSISPKADQSNNSSRKAAPGILSKIE